MYNIRVFLYKYNYKNCCPAYVIHYCIECCGKGSRDRELQNPQQKHLVDGKLDFSVQQRILDFGFVDGQRGDSDFRSRTSIGALTLHICKDLKSKFIGGDFITDSFTTKYSDHKPIYIILK